MQKIRFENGTFALKIKLSSICYIVYSNINNSKKPFYHLQINVIYYSLVYIPI